MYVNVCVGNESEAAAYAEAHGWETKDVKEIARKIAALPKVNSQRPRTVVFTQGAEQTILVQRESVKEYPIIKIQKDQIVDTNGAGDAFVGGFMSQYVQGKDFDTAVAAGHYVANIVIQRSGPTYPKEPHSFKA